MVDCKARRPSRLPLRSIGGCTFGACLSLVACASDDGEGSGRKIGEGDNAISIGGQFGDIFDDGDVNGESEGDSPGLRETSGGSSAEGDSDSDSDSELRCFRGEYIVSGSAAGDDLKCAPCPDGTFSTGVNADSCTEWTDCESIPALELRAPTARIDRECTVALGECFCASGIIILAANAADCAPLCARSTRENGQGGMGGLSAN